MGQTAPGWDVVLLPMTPCVRTLVYIVNVFQEYHNNNKDIIIDQTETKQVVYVYRCVGSTITVKGKVNSILLGRLLWYKPYNAQSVNLNYICHISDCEFSLEPFARNLITYVLIDSVSTGDYWHQSMAVIVRCMF